MAMGMTYADFWEGDPQMAVAYRKAYRLRREMENEQAWLQGIYFYDAVAVSLSNAFRGKGDKRQNYLERPIDIYPLTAQEKARREREEQAKLEAALKAMVRHQKRTKDE